MTHEPRIKSASQDSVALMKSVEEGISKCVSHSKARVGRYRARKLLPVQLYVCSMLQ